MAVTIYPDGSHSHKDPRGIEMAIGDEVLFVDVGKGTFKWRTGKVVRFTPQNVIIHSEHRWRAGASEECKKKPVYVIVKNERSQIEF